MCVVFDALPFKSPLPHTLSLRLLLLACNSVHLIRINYLFTIAPTSEKKRAKLLLMQFSFYSFPFVCSGQCALNRWIYGCQFLKRPRKKYEDQRSSLQTLSLAPMPSASTVLFAIVLCACGHPRKCVCVCVRAHDVIHST